ncbi:MAG: YdhR family protein [Pseudomonadota bacterium]
MVTELVFFDLPKGASREEVLALYRQTAGTWAENPDLIQKHYVIDEESWTGGGVYIWKDRAAAQRWHGPEFVEMVTARYGGPPRIQILDAVLRVDAVAGRVEEL